MSKSTSRFALDRKAAGDQLIRGNEKMQSIQTGAMSSLLATVTAQFFQEFGFEGSFTLKEYSTDRFNVKLAAGDKRTAGALKASPGWLNQFVDNIVI